MNIATKGRQWDSSCSLEKGKIHSLISEWHTGDFEATHCGWQSQTVCMYPRGVTHPCPKREISFLPCYNSWLSTASPDDKWVFIHLPIPLLKGAQRDVSIIYLNFSVKQCRLNSII